MATTDDWLQRVGGIRQWARRGERAPHKPLLLLYSYSLGRLRQTGTTRVDYRDAEPTLAHLLREYGPGGRPSTPAYPFHHLQTDGLWVVENMSGQSRPFARIDSRFLEDVTRGTSGPPTRHAVR